MRLRLVLVALTLLASGCQLSQLQFVADQRLTFEQPKARTQVTLPLTVRWSMKGFTASGLDGSSDDKAGIYAVFVDRAPMPAGKDVRWLVRDDQGCAHDPRCPNAKYLADNGIFLTEEPSITLSLLPSAPDGVGDEQHYVNVVLLNGAGKRIGESAWYLPFTTERREVS
ncbi:MAG: hypothetical protein QOE05_3103 [Actinomycetota bacterium]|jgi:hypothetical protein|nr:hypothetical protein [Actinomycetota bacterium]